MALISIIAVTLAPNRAPWVSAIRLSVNITSSGPNGEPSCQTTPGAGEPSTWWHSSSAPSTRRGQTTVSDLASRGRAGRTGSTRGRSRYSARPRSGRASPWRPRPPSRRGACPPRLAVPPPLVAALDDDEPPQAASRPGLARAAPPSTAPLRNVSRVTRPELDGSLSIRSSFEAARNGRACAKNGTYHTGLWHACGPRAWAAQADRRASRSEPGYMRPASRRSTTWSSSLDGSSRLAGGVYGRPAEPRLCLTRVSNRVRFLMRRDIPHKLDLA